ncbi:hypothetical protein [Nodosilinea sp. E11]|uniref:hypothetical protein n=1 Tax=Nodosilinea sp. E11 TaxID=3037479 RepID=UPI002934D4E3|nr:hypothetical protein [Nodosilinea sp. E11]WOD38546.1 hypothetical protein RRF56_20260 [Nodosilinea sp. E11]
MLVSSSLIEVPTVNRLVELWSNRYLPNLKTLPLGQDTQIHNELRHASSAQGRAETLDKIRAQRIDKCCRLAAIRVKDLYTASPEILDLGEVKQLADAATNVYLKLFEVYQSSLPIDISSTEQLQETYGESALSAWGIPKIEKLADELEPLILELQEKHKISKDWRTLGFITTQINFSNALFLDILTPVERVLINPYLNFLEEQVALPLKRLCGAAAKHVLSSPEFELVMQMLPITRDISAAVCARLTKGFPHYQGRRGTLNDLAVQHSCMRDLDMFQIYLWLCVLQGNLTTVEQELVALCIMVLENVGISWALASRWNEVLMDEILHRVTPSQQSLLAPYTNGMIRAFEYDRVPVQR